MKANDLSTKAELAELLGIEPATVGRYLAEVGEPSLDNLRRMAPRIGVLLADLMIEAELATEAEMGRVPIKAKARAKELRRAEDITDDETIPARRRKILLRTIDHACTAFLEMNEGLPVEPAMRRKARV